MIDPELKKISKKVIRLRGYSNNNNDYKVGKEAIEKGWPALTENEQAEWVKQGGWIGGVIADGHITIDVDSKEKGKVVYEGLLRASYSFIAIETPHGYQFIFRDIGRVKNQGSKRLTLGGIAVDYRLANKGYIVMPTSNTEGRQVIHNLTDQELDPMPLFFLPVRGLKETDQELEKILEGSRTTTFISHAAKIREWNVAHNLNFTLEEKRQILNEVSQILCYPPLEREKIDIILHSAESYATISAPTQGKPIVLSKFYPRPFTKQILEKHKFFWEGIRGNLYWHNPSRGIWQSNAEEFIEFYFRSLTDLIDDILKKKHVIGEIVADVKGCSWKNDPMPEPDINLVPFLNGIYDLSTDTFRQYKAEDFFTWQLPHNYNPDARTVFLKQVIDTTLPRDRVITLYEIMAYCLYRVYLRHLFFLCYGAGANGKGTFFTILKNALGMENVSGVSLNDIQQNSFSAANLFRKLANLSGEMNYVDIKDTRLLKELTGSDMIEANRKYLKFIKFVNHAKLIFSTNSLPKTSDTTDAFYRRAFIVRFNFRFQPNPGIDLKVRDTESAEMRHEYEGLLVILLDHLKRLKKNNFRFTREPTIEETRKLYEYLSNPLMVFIEENCERTRKHEDFVYKYEFRERLNSWLEDRRMNSYTAEKIGREMKEHSYEDSRKPAPNDEEKKYTVWVGIKWKENLQNDNLKDNLDRVCKEFKDTSTSPYESIGRSTNYPEYPKYPAQEDEDSDILGWSTTT